MGYRIQQTLSYNFRAARQVDKAGIGRSKDRRGRTEEDDFEEARKMLHRQDFILKYEEYEHDAEGGGVRIAMGGFVLNFEFSITTLRRWIILRFVGSNAMLEAVKRYCIVGRHSCLPKARLNIDTTFNVGRFYLTLLVCRIPILEEAGTGRSWWDCLQRGQGSKWASLNGLIDQ
ncbi:MAG: hypothetical protein GY820_30080 [Gammaproteobacteria bacterium]|nr:hypothetical protein [Gammaproteobacteria bacterium]